MQQRYSSVSAQPGFRPPAQLGFTAPAPYDYAVHTAPPLQVLASVPMLPPVPRPPSVSAAALLAARSFVLPVLVAVPGAEDKDYVPKGLFFCF